MLLAVMYRSEDPRLALEGDLLWLYTNEVMTENVSLYNHLGYQEFDRRCEAGYNRIFMEKLLAPARSAM